MAVDAPARARDVLVIALVAVVTATAVTVVGAALSPVRRAPPGARTGTARRAEHTRGGRRRRQRTIDRELPDLLDLFVVTVQAGYTPLDAISSLRPVVHPLLGTVLQTVLDRIGRGERFVDALTSFTDALGSHGASFVDTLTMTERAGLPVGPAIDRLAHDARQHRRRVAEADARQLPVRLSFPLVLCTLTSFVLVAIVPLLLGALTSFDRSSP
jgi:tight adherence protein C